MKQWTRAGGGRLQEIVFSHSRASCARRPVHLNSNFKLSRSKVLPSFKAQLGQGLIVLGHGGQFGQAGGGQIALEFNHHKTCAPAVIQLLLFGFQRGFGKQPGLAVAIHLRKPGFCLFR